MRPGETTAADHAEATRIDESTLTNFVNRIARWKWTITETSLRTRIIDATLTCRGTSCCPIAVLALDASPNELRRLLEEPAHAATADHIKLFEEDDSLYNQLEDTHEKTGDPEADDDLFLVHAAALAIHRNPRTEFAAAVTGLELQTITAIADAADNVSSAEGRRLTQALAKAAADENLTAQIPPGPTDRENVVPPGADSPQ